jgi:hypothetical protein
MRFSAFVVRRKNTVNWQARSPGNSLDRAGTKYSLALYRPTRRNDRKRSETEPYQLLQLLLKRETKFESTYPRLKAGLFDTGESASGS